MSEEEVLPENGNEEPVIEQPPAPTLQNLNDGYEVTFALVEAYTDGDLEVDAVFTKGDKKHTRKVNVCLDADGKYDETAMLVRLAEVRDGVANKMALGIF